MASSKPETRETDGKLSVFVQDVTTKLRDGQRYQIPGLGTFSVCTRKAATSRPACKMAMFRASSELREYANGGRSPLVSGPYAEVVQGIIEAMFDDHGIDVPNLNRMAVVKVAGKKPKLIFHGSDELNTALQ